MAYIDTKYLGKCETCRHHSDSGCNIWCDAGEGYSPNMLIIPTADVVEVKHGEWIDKDDEYGRIYCSLCGAQERLSDSQYKSHRCPVCGAKMDGGKK